MRRDMSPLKSMFILYILIYTSPLLATKQIYTQDWFTVRTPEWKKHLKKYFGAPNVKYLEVGAFEGKSAFWVLDNILTGKNSKAILVDPLFPSYEKIFLHNLNINPQKNKVVVHKGYSEEVLRKLKLNSFDIIYIDGHHTAAAVYQDAALSWGLLKNGGVLIFDDYEWRMDERQIHQTPRMSIDAFLVAFKEDIKVLHTGWQVFVQKKLKNKKPDEFLLTN